MRLQPDDVLLADLAAGRSEAYAVLYDRYGPALLRVARTLLHGYSGAEDAVQDVFVNLVRQRHRLALVLDWDAYLFAMLRHAASRRMTRDEAERRHLREMAAGRVSHAPPAESDDSLQAALAQLPPRQREIVAMKIDGELTFAQIGEILKTSPNTVASRYRYALEKLREMLKESPMKSSALPPELQELENRLRGRNSSEPTADLRGRILKAVELELFSRNQEITPQKGNGWAWAAIAAAALIAMNLSMIDASQNEFSRRLASSPSQMSGELQALRLIESQPEGQFK